MSNMTSKTVTLTLKNQSTIELSCFHLTTDSTTIPVLDFIKEPGLLISLSHGLLNTQLDLSGVAPYVALQFDEHFNFSGAGLSLGNAAGSYGIITQAKQVLILPFGFTPALEQVSQLTIQPTR